MTTTKLPKKVYQEKEKRNEALKKQTTLDLPAIPKLSESLVQDLFDYKKDMQCGLYIDHKYIQRQPIIYKESEKLDLYFKAKAINEEAEAQYTKAGKMSLPYIRMNTQSQNFQRFMLMQKWKVEKTNFEFTNPKFTGTTDIIALDENIKSKVVFKKRFLIDLRTSNNISEDWDGAIKDIDYLKAIHHKMLANYEFGIDDIPYYIMIFSTKNDWEFKVIKLNVDPMSYKAHYKNLMNAKKYLDENYLIGFKKKADLQKCNNCPILDNCLDSIDTPKIEEIWL